MRGMSRSASAPDTSAMIRGVLPYQRPSTGQLLVRTGLPQPTTSYRVQRVSFARLNTTQLCTAKTPFQAPAAPVNTTMRAVLSVEAAGKRPVLDQSASRQKRGA